MSFTQLHMAETYRLSTRHSPGHTDHIQAQVHSISYWRYFNLTTNHVVSLFILNLPEILRQICLQGRSNTLEIANFLSYHSIHSCSIRAIEYVYINTLRRLPGRPRPFICPALICHVSSVRQSTFGMLSCVSLDNPQRWKITHSCPKHCHLMYVHISKPYWLFAVIHTEKFYSFC